MQATTLTQTQRIKQLNDKLRTTLLGGRVVVTAQIAALSDYQKARVLAAVMGFTAFNHGNDPHDEHDFALIETVDGAVIFKIDYYDLDLKYHSPDASDPEVTTRVMTVMFAEEY